MKKPAETISQNEPQRSARSISQEADGEYRRAVTSAIKATRASEPLPRKWTKLVKALVEELRRRAATDPRSALTFCDLEGADGVAWRDAEELDQLLLVAMEHGFVRGRGNGDEHGNPSHYWAS